MISTARWLMAFYFIYYGTTAMNIIYLPLVLKEKGLSLLEIGAFLSAGLVAGAVAQPSWGAVSDRLGGVKRIILCCLVGMTVGLGILFTSEDSMLLLIGYLIFVIFSSPVIPLVDSWNMSLSEIGGRPYGAYRIWGSLGFACAAPCMGWISQQTGPVVLYVLYSGGLVLSLICLLPLPDEPRHTSSTKSNWSIMMIWTGKPGLWFIMGALLLLGCASRAADNFTGIYAQDIGGTELFVGLCWSVAALCEIPFFYRASAWLDKYGPIRVLCTAAACYGVKWLLIWTTGNLAGLMISQTLQGATFALMYVAAMYYVRSIVPMALRSTGQMLLSMWMFSLAGVLGSGIGGWLMNKGHSMELFAVCILLAGAAFVLLLAGVHRNKSPRLVQTRPGI
ncbi:MFS transporter [Paenibacillus qinlingensis]|uniref:PPP family 3-phenylpropionic acid transporter n=1 Tax=Paenibacillus qinlingensis TaxID=1837343 RepID=A0ABU1NVY4_9BACL|nr:MFS transporter [Paenibacillus qinlingensis]MDR6551620.1 PPP family 3-phenylpropionic acid transporter [Paenibacillus qinlingensis]